MNTYPSRPFLPIFPSPRYTTNTNARIRRRNSRLIDLAFYCTSITIGTYAIVYSIFTMVN
jgi:hypothetical protein